MLRISSEAKVFLDLLHIRQLECSRAAAASASGHIHDTLNFHATSVLLLT
jgi:hypothetical protein